MLARTEASKISLILSVGALLHTPKYYSNHNISAVQALLYGHGDTNPCMEQTKKVLDELLTDFITELCFEAHHSAQLAGRQKIKVEDVKFACRKNPQYLGKIEEISMKKRMIDTERRLVDGNDDKITKSNLKGMEEPLGDADDDGMDIDVSSEIQVKKRKGSAGRAGSARPGR